MSEVASNKQIEQISRLLADLYSVDAFYLQGSKVVFSLSCRYDPVQSRRMIEDRLTLAGYDFDAAPASDLLRLTVTPKRRLRIPAWNIVLFLATLLSVYVVPVLSYNLDKYSWREAFHRTLSDLAEGQGIEFTLALMSMLIVHEMGHFIASRRRGIITSWPYFIPAPNIIGTFGAVIKSKSPFWNRRDLIEVGAAGPVAGWLVALFWLIYGLPHSTIADPSAFGGPVVGSSLLLDLLVPMLIPNFDPNQMYMLSEAAMAGWFGLLVTAINLLPIGQLDGGHIIYGLAPRRQVRLGWLGIILLGILGFQSPMWWLFAALGLVMGVGHPPTLDDRRPVSLGVRMLGWAALLILLLSFTPVPLR